MAFSAESLVNPATSPLTQKTQPARANSRSDLDFIGGSDKMAEILGSKWIIRGWTFQEERLARRALVFGENKLFFNCRTLERSEDTEMSVFRAHWVLAITEDPKGRPLDLTDTADPGHWDNWQTLCTHYAFRELTFPEDKLLAISGIASKTGKKCESQYLAGLWKTNIVHDLFRKTVGVATKPKNYRAPSWSWASLDGRITRPSWEHDSVSEDCSMRCTILDVQTTPSGLDPYGAVEDGLLKIEGALLGMKLVWQGFHRPWALFHEGKIIGSTFPDIECDSMTVQGRENTCQDLLVAFCIQRGGQGSGISRGLLLKKNGRKREANGEFERIGTFVLSHDAGIWEGHAKSTIIIV